MKDVEMAAADNSEQVPSVVATPAALDAIGQLLKSHRKGVVFFQSGGCCDNSAPMCFEEGEMIIGQVDRLIGNVGGCPYYIDFRQYETYRASEIILDVEDGEADGFSLPAGREGKHFITRTKICATNASCNV
jgi:uncharacterized protein (DUF779 family)